MTRYKSKNDFDEEPVVYCSRCYSLKIKNENDLGLECCADCGCVDIAQTDIYQWEKMYSRRYGHRYVEGSNDVRSSYIFSLTISELKQRLNERQDWKEIIKYLYPAFPEGLNKVESILLLFDKLSKDRNIDALRMVLSKK